MVVGVVLAVAVMTAMERTREMTEVVMMIATLTMVLMMDT